jgi:hypothetical protein
MKPDIKVSDKLPFPIFRAHFYLQEGKSTIIETHQRPYKTMNDVITTTTTTTNIL